VTVEKVLTFVTNLDLWGVQLSITAISPKTLLNKRI